MVDPSLDLDITRGWPYLRHNLIHDLAALNKAEMLSWDAWGLADEHSPEQHDLELLDRIARATTSPNPAPADLRELYNNDLRLRVPASVRSYDPLGGPPREVSFRSLKPQPKAAS